MEVIVRKRDPRVVRTNLKGLVSDRQRPEGPPFSPERPEGSLFSSVTLGGLSERRLVTRNRGEETKIKRFRENRDLVECGR